MFISCTLSVNVEAFQLLPQPQILTINISQSHRLLQGELDTSRIAEKIINTIPEATINSDEAYRLRITPDSILIEAVSEKGIYWAHQTLAQIIESSDGKSVTSVEIIDWPSFRIRGFMHDN